MSECYADLHLHTTASDGTQDISEQVGRAKKLGFSTIAITDHDTIATELTGRVTQIDGIEVITGSEIKALFDGVPGELLGYFVAPELPALQEIFAFMKQSRVERMAKMLERCRKRVGVDITADEVSRMAAGSIGRPHLAQLLVEKGVVPSIREAFNRFIAKGRACYVPLEKPDFRKVIQTVHDAGGITAIAHPCFMRVEEWNGFLHTARTEGVDGIEVFYPYELAARDLCISPAELTSLAEKHGFLLTGGSDDHGLASDKETLGKVKVPCRYVDEIKAACGIT